MAQAARADVESIKNKITAKEVTYRILGKNEQATYPNIATMVGASNRPFNQLISDPTGARRFFEIETAEKMDYDRIQSIDVTALWKSVDESQDTPILAHLEEIGALQHQNLRTIDVVEQFVDAELALSEADSTPNEAVYESFKQWMDRCAPGQHVLPYNKAIERVTEVLFQKAPRGLFQSPKDIKKKKDVQHLRCVFVKGKRSAISLALASSFPAFNSPLSVAA